jgi:ADP-heptose:LPS heptosyltransferase
VAYYLRAARAMLGEAIEDADSWCVSRAPGEAREAALELAISAAQQKQADDVLARAGVETSQPLALLNPGGNNPAKRWPAARFAEVARELAARHGMRSLINGSPAEADLTRDIAEMAGSAATSLADVGVTIGSLKGIVARCRIMVTNDTGPRHIAAALRVPVVAVFGPTDPHWTIIHAPAGEEILTPEKLDLAAGKSGAPATEAGRAGGESDGCTPAIERISVSEVLAACERLLARGRVSASG